ncbi:hypothetical protein OB920_09095 [Halobacteria archaeon HArc-gm2]|nr:hypothetical protein [Halobacteria archaeon HArc-gm2]
MRGRLLVGAVAVLIVLAGCTGNGPPSEAPVVSADGSSGESAGASGTTVDEGDGTNEDTVAAQWERFSFEEGEFYRYRVNDVRNGETATLTWDVVAVDGSEVTADVTLDDGNRSYTRTVTGENATILWDLRNVDYESDDADAAIRTVGYLTLGPFNAMTAYYEHRELEVGNSWRLSGTPEAGYMTANVEGRNSYAGLECYETAIRVPDGEEWADSDSYEFESCITPDASLALRTAYYDGESGEKTVEIVLEEYRSG